MEGGGGSSSTSRFMAIEEYYNLLCPPEVSSYANTDAGHTLLPLPFTNLQDLYLHGSTGGSYFMMPEEEHKNNNSSTSTGYYFMESDSDMASCSLKAMMPPSVSFHANTAFLPLPYQDLDLHGSTGGGGSFMMPEEDHHMNSSNSTSTGYYFMENNRDAASCSLKAKITAHPHYHRLLAAYVNCQKIGAPPEVVVRLEEACASPAAIVSPGTSCVGEDPTLDQFMESYCEMLIKYEQELLKPINQAMLFLSKMECRFKELTLSPSDSACVEPMDRNGSSEEFKVLKDQLLQKYCGHLGSLKHKYSKKRKRDKLPIEAKEQLLEWWNKHLTWPYPKDNEKLVLVESTGLSMTQVNWWFTNQRRRHWLEGMNATCTKFKNDSVSHK